MRKYFEGLSPIGGALILFSVLLGSFLRLYNLDLISHSSDELATLYFSKYTNLIFIEEAHPPGFYWFGKLVVLLFGESIIALRAAVASLSILFCLYFAHYSKRIFNKSGWLLFIIILFLLPIDIVYARMARMYSPLYILAMWFFLCTLEHQRDHWKLFGISLVMSWIFPLGLLPAACFLLTNLVFDRKWSRENTFLLASIIPVIIYYLSRLVVVGGKNFIGNYSAGDKGRSFFKDFVLLMAGDHFPKFNFFSANNIVLLLVSIVFVLAFGVAVYILVKRNWNTRALVFHIFLILVSVLFFQGFSHFLVNIKVGRYLIYLAPLFVIYASLFSNFFKIKNTYLIPGFVFFALTLILYFFPPVTFYPWERESFKAFTELREKIPGSKYVFCGNKYQYDFYFKSPHKHCLKELEILKNNKENFVFIDMNGFVTDGLNSFSKDYLVVNYKVVGGALMFIALHRANIEKNSTEENTNE